ncbi:hypothetical protein Hamer_G011634 [Homarus americanus]|uniref:Uncharacterized protein n=1 Tax=Homarus americanus TaxID=6706 RepID=A0A8J5MZ95_HOMAM|nr:hypothetical protein Hamer_G011634 [Homarus americanus]
MWQWPTCRCQAALPRPHTTSRGPPILQTHSAGRVTPAHQPRSGCMWLFLA